MNMKRKEILELVIKTSLLAGDEIMKVYETDFDVDYKEDESPLTLADKAAHNIIIEKLEQTGIPVLSEEGTHLPYSVRKQWDRLWVVDPLDGTKEFIKRNGEFTVNIALVEKNQPKMGVIFCPTLKILYFADDSIGGAYKAVFTEEDYHTLSLKDLLDHSYKLPQDKGNGVFTVVASRSHLTDETKEFVAKIEAQVREIKFVSRGSSLKLCMVAEGEAELYPRYAPTSEWDTAAGQAIVENSGGKVLIADTSLSMDYNKENILNPWFLVIGKDVESKIKI
jgi:3'(2'), 5'-bisphosphate nucleotidase